MSKAYLDEQEDPMNAFIIISLEIYFITAGLRRSVSCSKTSLERVLGYLLSPAASCLGSLMLNMSTKSLWNGEDKQPDYIQLINVSINDVNVINREVMSEYVWAENSKAAIN